MAGGPPTQQARNPPEFAEPRLSRSNGSHPQREGTNLGVFVPIWLVLPRREATNLNLFDLCHSTHSSRAVQIRVGLSGKKRHINIILFPGDSSSDRGVSRPGGQGSNVYVLSSEPKEHKSFAMGTRPGGPVTGATGQSFMCSSFLCLF